MNQVSALEMLCRTLPPIASQRIYTALLRRSAATAPRTPFVAPTITGSRFAYLSGDVLADTVRACGFWDWRNLAIAAALCACGDIIVEIGANTGTETLGYADVVGPSGRVHAFEPEAGIARALRDNLALNGRDNVTVHPVAVGDRPGTVPFAPSSHEANSGAGHVAPVMADAAHVPIVTLDALSGALGRARFVAIDVEGHEVAVIRGAVRYLSWARPAVVVEACTPLLSRAGERLGDLAGALARCEYDVFEIGRLGLRPLRFAAATSPRYERNWLALPRESPSLRDRVQSSLWRCALLPRMPALNPLSAVAARRAA